MVVQEVTLSSARLRAHPKFRHLLPSIGEQQQRASSRDQPFFLSPPSSLDHTRIAEHAGAGDTMDPVLRVVLIYGVNDGIKDPFLSKKSTLCNRPWTHYFPPSCFRPATATSSSNGRVSDPPLPHSASSSDFAADSLHSIAHLSLDPDDDNVWEADVPLESRTLWNARLYPVLIGEHQGESILWLQYPMRPSVQTLCEWKQSTRVSLQDVLMLSDAPGEFYWRARASFLVDLKEMESTLLERRDRSLLPLIARCQPEYKNDLLQSLDGIASASPLDVCSRTLCSIADVLASLPGAHLHTRTGPARNPQWQSAIGAMASSSTRQQQADAVALLASMRSQWLKVGSAQLYMRAARHYDAAWASLTRKGVETAQQTNISHSERATPILIGQIVEVTSGVRIDLMGGWSDTPPCCYEHGGAVTNVAISINDEHPIGASCQVFAIKPSASSTDHSVHDRVIIVKTGKSRSITLDPMQALQEDDVDDTCMISSLADFHDYNDPSAPAALVKCALLCLNVVNLDSPVPLREQIAKALLAGSWNSAEGTKARAQVGVGLFVRTWSTLPQGTGLGVSSILAADLITAVAACFGQSYDHSALMHLVLLVEQKLTTGGGFQDQVGGCYPGFKISTSANRLPMTVAVETIAHQPALIDQFNQHVLLIHSGQSRLAKNLLGNVLRRWYQRDQSITRVQDDLVRGAHDMRKAIEAGDLPLIGQLMQRYWDLKKIMASPAPTRLKAAKEPSVEPAHIQRLTARLRPHIHGLNCVGAGGGGFICLLTVQPIAQSRPLVQNILDQLNHERQEHAQKLESVLSTGEEQDEFHDDWPTGDYILYKATICEKGMLTNIL